MKNAFTITIGLFFTVSFFACKKDRVCSCQYAGGADTVNTTLEGYTKSAAKEECDKLESQYGGLLTCELE